MHILRHAPEVLAFTHPIRSIPQLLRSRLQYVRDDLCWFIVLNPQDTAADLARAMQALWIDLWEWRQDHPDFHELVFVHNDSGYGPVVIVPRCSHPTVLAAL